MHPLTPLKFLLSQAIFKLIFYYKLMFLFLQSYPLLHFHPLSLSSQHPLLQHHSLIPMATPSTMAMLSGNSQKRGKNHLTPHLCLFLPPPFSSLLPFSCLILQLKHQYTHNDFQLSKLKFLFQERQFSLLIPIVIPQLFFKKSKKLGPYSMSCLTGPWTDVSLL